MNEMDLMQLGLMNPGPQPQMMGPPSPVVGPPAPEMQAAPTPAPIPQQPVAPGPQQPMGIRERLATDPNFRQALMIAGLSMMGGKSTNFFENFSGGALAGVNALDQLRQRDAGNARADRQEGRADRSIGLQEKQIDQTGRYQDRSLGLQESGQRINQQESQADRTQRADLAAADRDLRRQLSQWEIGSRKAIAQIQAQDNAATRAAPGALEKDTSYIAGILKKNVPGIKDATAERLALMYRQGEGATQQIKPADVAQLAGDIMLDEGSTADAAAQKAMAALKGLGMGMQGMTVDDVVALAKQSVGPTGGMMQSPNGGQMPSPNAVPLGTTAVNPTTGERLTWNGNAWVPAQ